ncbi:hypothetical protein B0H67DRAFT_248712 [Lasiosphaeris hirsuta]|uniref:Uncharacterized protein n=1 Tax=Lasiosphaeris hirsuta TaxID=260670 RepID=A0AA40AH79_9PEZI|nr:hypothetical protein B0H67DRAFT_248712 [Lasiosphaeris hirsuta]
MVMELLRVALCVGTCLGIWMLGVSCLSSRSRPAYLIPLRGGCANPTSIQNPVCPSKRSLPLSTDKIFFLDKIRRAAGNGGPEICIGRAGVSASWQWLPRSASRQTARVASCLARQLATWA